MERLIREEKELMKKESEKMKEMLHYAKISKSWKFWPSAKRCVRILNRARFHILAIFLGSEQS